MWKSTCWFETPQKLFIPILFFDKQMPEVFCIYKNTNRVNAFTFNKRSVESQSKFQKLFGNKTFIQEYQNNTYIFKTKATNGKKIVTAKLPSNPFYIKAIADGKVI